MTTIIHQPSPGECEYRCTLPELYPKPALGHKDPGARQGHYYYVKDEEHAREKMLQRFPAVKRVDVELWKPGKGAKA
jgi:hypothetical protein